MVTPASSGPTPAQRVRQAVEPAVTAAGLVLEDVAVKPAGRRTVVRVVVDLDDDALGSLDLDTVGEVSRDVSAALDAADPVKGEYVLEVSTPGTDRPLTELRHFRRARTRLVRLTLRDGSVVTGRLAEADADGYVLDPAPDGVATRTTLAPADVVRGQVEVELTRLADTGHDAPHDPMNDDEEGDA
ncbi:ribosome maturation factor RimP [Actinotalea sp. JY-7885]|nr:ribosome maturation factor RimP [Actinotalea sp. JY-7885]